MRSFLFTTILVCLALPAAGHEIEGAWEGSVTCDASTHPIRLEFTKGSGAIDMPDRFLAGERITDAKATPATLTFTVRGAKFNAKLERGRISGTVQSPDGTAATFDVVRTPRAADAFRVLDEGTLLLPAGSGPFRAVVIVPARDARIVAQRFAAAGVAALIASDAAAGAKTLRERKDVTASLISVIALGEAQRADQPQLVVPLPSMEHGCAWFGLNGDARIDRAIAWSLHQPKPPTPASEGSSTYDEACRAARNGEYAKALALLDRAIDEGFNDTARIEHDDDLAPLRDLSGFDSIVHKSAMLELPCANDAPLTCWQDAIVRLDQARIEYPRSGRAAFNFALAAQKIGDHASAANAFNEAAGLRYKPLASSYAAALSYGRSGDRWAMIRSLERALQLGLPVPRLLADPDFASFREDPEVKTLITRYGTNWPD
jgi:hypothetical protein